MRFFGAVETETALRPGLWNRSTEREQEPKQFWMAGAGSGANKFQMVEPEPEIWFLV